VTCPLAHDRDGHARVQLSVRVVWRESCRVIRRRPALRSRRPNSSEYHSGAPTGSVGPCVVSVRVGVDLASLRMRRLTTGAVRLRDECLRCAWLRVGEWWAGLLIPSAIDPRRAQQTRLRRSRSFVRLGALRALPVFRSRTCWSACIGIWSRPPSNTALVFMVWLPRRFGPRSLRSLRSGSAGHRSRHPWPRAGYTWDGLRRVACARHGWRRSVAAASRGPRP